ncbi:MAG: Trk family potassium uptake protein [Bacilli bacterium]|nr:Trk family potassium uptake protein [Bacilli bacterium]
MTALFTSASATCVTGLVVVDTGTYWSIFGQIIILLLIQIGGIGFMTILSIIWIALKKKINIGERKLIGDAASAKSSTGALDLIKKIIIITFVCEGIGAVILSFAFAKDYGVLKGIYFGIFHSISAFCNAGFDLIGGFASLTAYAENPLICITIMVLVVVGGLGFIVWTDLFDKKFNLKKISLHSKIVLATTLVLIVGPAILFFVFENDGAFKDLSFGNKIINALFQSITCRTCGMNTVDMASLSDSSSMISIVLMIIGGSPGSTAGGIKTTTFAVLFLSIIAVGRKKNEIVIGKRKLEPNVMTQASAIMIFYITLVILASSIIMMVEHRADVWTFRGVMFEVSSAIGTVGLSMVGTPTLSIASQIIIIILMFIGRLGALSIILFISGTSRRDADKLGRPEEKILIG